MIEINTERLIIRRFSEKDGEDLYEYFSNPRVLEFEPYKPFLHQLSNRLLSLFPNNKRYSVYKSIICSQKKQL